MKISRQYGLSLLEILVTLVIVSILSALAVPGMQEFIKNNRARAIADDFVISLYRARSEAVKRNFNVTMCASNDTQTGCDNSVDDFSGGWIIFTDYDDDQTVDAENILFDVIGDGVEATKVPEEILYISGVPAGDFEIDANKSNALKRVVTYDSTGLISGTPMFSYLITEVSSDKQLARIVISRTGRIRSCVGDSTRCPAP